MLPQVVGRGRIVKQTTCIIFGLFTLVISISGCDDAPTRAFTEADLYIDDVTRPYKDVLVQGVNWVAATNPRCETIDPGSAYVSMYKGTPESSVFFVTCGDSIANTVNVFFSAADIQK
jgi:hypothetical protein